VGIDDPTVHDDAGHGSTARRPQLRCCGPDPVKVQDQRGGAVGEDRVLTAPEQRSVKGPPSVCRQTRQLVHLREHARPAPAETPHLTRGRLDLSIKLPIGTEDGVYTVQFRSNGDGPAAEATGSATWNGTSEVLKITTDLRTVPPGSYTIAILSANSSVRHYPVFLE